jgi:hypothetical protein
MKTDPNYWLLAIIIIGYLVIVYKIARGGKL